MNLKKTALSVALVSLVVFAALSLPSVAAAEPVKAIGDFKVLGTVSEVLGFYLPALSSIEYHQLKVGGAEVLVFDLAVKVPEVGSCVLVSGEASSVITNDGQGPLGWFRVAESVEELPAERCR